MSHRVKFITDTTCDLPLPLLEKFDISVLSLHVFLGDEDHLDGVDITRQDLFDYANKTKRLPRTAAASVLDFVMVFKEAFDQGYDEIIFTGLSSKLSSTFQNAVLAAKGLEEIGYDPSKVFCLDSLQLSTGTAHLLVRGKQLAEQGMHAAQIVKELGYIVPRLCSSFVVDTLEYLHMGGRCSSVVYVASSMLKIHPQISVVDGGMVVGDKFRGSLEHCLANYQRKMVVDVLDSIEPELIFITHTCEPAVAEKARKEIQALGYFKDILVTDAGATISSHCGPGTLGYLYVKKA